MFDAGSDNSDLPSMVGASMPWQGNAGFGLLLIDGAGQLIIGNREAARILAYPDPEPDFDSLHRLLNEKLDAKRLARTDHAQVFISGRRHYICHQSELDIGFGARERVKAVVMTRKPALQVAHTRLAEEYSMTPRECETVTWLLRGLSGKEIATRMDISPHTVKVFLRQIMVKMNVSSRVGIIARVLNSR